MGMTPDQIQAATDALRVISDGFKHLPGQHDQSTHGRRGPSNSWIYEATWWHGTSSPGLSKVRAKDGVSRYPGMGTYYSLVGNNFATTSYHDAARYAQEAYDADVKNGLEGRKPVVYQVRPTSDYAEPDPHGGGDGWGSQFDSMDEAGQYWADGGTSIAIAFSDDMEVLQETDPSQYDAWNGGSQPTPVRKDDSTKQMHVATPAGERRYGAPIGTPLPLPDNLQLALFNDVSAPVRSKESKARRGRFSGAPMGLFPPCGYDATEGQREDDKQWVRDRADSLAMSKEDVDIYLDAMRGRQSARKYRDDLWNDVDDDSKESLVGAMQDIRANGEVHIAADPEVATRILMDGKFKSLFVTGTSNGSTWARGRQIIETTYLDLHPSTVDDKRPIYGYVSPTSTVPSGPNMYGLVRFILKDSVKARTTMTLGDSLGSDAVPIPMTGELTQREVFDATFGSRIGQTHLTEGVSVEDYSDEENEYVEAQILGGVTVDDIAEIVYPADFDEGRAAGYPQGWKGYAAKLGIKVGTYERRSNYDYYEAMSS